MLRSSDIVVPAASRTPNHPRAVTVDGDHEAHVPCCDEIVQELGVSAIVLTRGFDNESKPALDEKSTSFWVSLFMVAFEERTLFARVRRHPGTTYFYKVACVRPVIGIHVHFSSVMGP
jgi:hypothetical protein